MSHVIKFIITLFISLVIAFTLHITIIYYKELPLFQDKIIAAYIINFIIATGIYLGLFISRKKYAEQLGFLYLGGSFIKFIFFFIFFYPYYKADGELTTSEFMAFFIPYVISLVFETLGVIKFLKK